MTYKSFSIRIQIMAAMAAMLAGIWFYVIHELNAKSASAIATAELETRSLAHAYSENVVATIKRIDVVLQEMSRDWQRSPESFPEQFKRLQDDIGDIAVQVAIIDRDGWVRFSSAGTPSQPMNLSEREHFRAFADGTGNRLFISKPVVGRVSNKWSVQFARPIVRDGRFDGIAVFSVSPETLANFHRTISVGAAGIAAVVRNDGAVLARAPLWERFIAHTVSAVPYLEPGAPRQGNFQRKSELDGIDRILGFHRLEEYGLTLIVGKSVHDILAPAHAQAQLTLTVTALATALFLLLALTVHRRLVAREAEAAEVRRQNAHLEERVADRTRELAQANAELSLAASVFHNTVEGVLITDTQATILSVNPAFTEITGYTAAEVIGGKPSLLRSDHHEPSFYEGMWKTLLEQGRWQGEIWNRRKNGEAYLEYLTISAVPGEDSKPSRYVSVFHDITESRRKDEHIRHLAFHDPLTGLPNRALFLDRLRHAIGRARRNGGSLAVTFIDLDGFKSVNDSLGHNVGDELLKEVATRIRARLRRDVDTVARLGGDEFVILMEELRETGHCASLADEIIADIGKPVEVCGHVMRVGASMGMAFFPEDGDDALELMQRADTAMYAAKAAGKGSYRFFQSAMLEEVNRRLDMETALRAAVDAGELVLHYQPKVCLTDGRLLGVEALVRWNHPQRGQLLPDEFISMAEETGIIDRLGHWVLGEACRQAAVWRDGGTIIPIAVNVSARQLGSDGLVDTVAGLLAQHRLPGMALQIELTETALMANPHRATAVLGRLRDMGLAIAIDDFGTGYSSLSRLRQLPIDLIKIDRGFVANSDHDEKDARMVRIVVAMGQALGLDVVAEGVESETQASLLKDSGCIACQGFLFAEPKPADLLDGWLAQGGNR